MRTLLLLPLLFTPFSPLQSNAGGGAPLNVVGFKWTKTRQKVVLPDTQGSTPAAALTAADKNFARNRRVNDPAGVRDPNADTEPPAAHIAQAGPIHSLTPEGHVETSPSHSPSPSAPSTVSARDGLPQHLLPPPQQIRPHHQQQREQPQHQRDDGCEIRMRVVHFGGDALVTFNGGAFGGESFPATAASA